MAKTFIQIIYKKRKSHVGGVCPQITSFVVFSNVHFKCKSNIGDRHPPPLKCVYAVTISVNIVGLPALERGVVLRVAARYNGRTIYKFNLPTIKTKIVEHPKTTSKMNVSKMSVTSDIW